MPHSCTIQRHYALEVRWPGLLLQVTFLRCYKTMRMHFMACVAAWGAKLILTANLVYYSSCASLGHLVMAQHCHFCLNVCFSLPRLLTCPHHPPYPPPTCPPPIDLICIVTPVKKTTSKAKDVRIACRISYEILGMCLGCSCSKFGVVTLLH